MNTTGVESVVRQCFVCGGPMRERTRKETTTENRLPKLISILKCKKCGSWVDLPSISGEKRRPK